MSWLLRYREHELPLPDGVHVIGRDKDCTVRLDDSSVSRRHAEVVVGVDGVTLRDLGSRNGVYLKYRRLAADEPVEIVHGDTFLVGQTNLVLLRTRKRKLRTLENALGVRDSQPVVVTGVGVPYRAFAEEADRALADGDFDRFAGATHLFLEALSAALEQGVTDETALAQATQHALTLADLRGIEWVDQLLALYEGSLIVPSIDTITTLQQLFAERRWRSDRLDRYVERIAPVLDDAGPRGRALLAQLEALRRQQS